MTQEPTQNREAFARRVNESLRKAEDYASRLQQTSTRLLASSIASSAATTLVTAVTAAQGPIVGEGPTGWRISCIVAAIFGFATTLLVGLNQQLKISDRLTQGNECAGRLKALDVAIATGSRSWDEITKEYEQVMRTYPEPVR